MNQVLGPLSGIRIVDLTRVMAGPYCTMVLADLGAEVIKVERPEWGDDSRGFGPFIEKKSAYFMSLNRGKKSIVLDLKDDKDRQIFDTLLGSADVLVENFRAGTLAKLGYGWDELHAAHPQLIYASTSGFGHSGPYRKKPAYDMVAQGMGGIMSLTGQPLTSQSGGEPTRVGSSIGDISAGLFTAIGICAALSERGKNGAGRKIDVAMLDCQLAILENALVRYSVTGEVPGPTGSRHPSIAPFAAFATQDSHIIITIGNEALFGKLAEALGRPELGGDERFSSNDLRCQNITALEEIMLGILAGKTTAEWITLLEDAGVPCAPINTVADLFDDPQIAARNMIVEMDDPVAGVVKMAGNPIKISGFEDPDKRSPAPDLDADRAAVLAELGISEE